MSTFLKDIFHFMTIDIEISMSCLPVEETELRNKIPFQIMS